MRYRALGSTGIIVSEIGFGAWGIGGRTAGATSYGDTDDALSLAALACAADASITFFDTSPAYGNGHSEILIGRALAGTKRDDVAIATKAGYVDWTKPPDFSPAAVRRSLEDSLRRLGTDHVELLQLHNPAPAVFATGALPDALDALVAEGKARCWGVSVKAPEEATAIFARATPAVVQLNLNMLDVRAVELGALAAAAAKGVGVIARTPLSFGFLSGALGPDTVFPPGDHRGGWQREQIARWAEGARQVQGAIGSGPSASWIQNALRFCLSFDAVSTVIPGMLSPMEVKENAAASDLGALATAEVEAILGLNRTTAFFEPHA